MNAAERAEKTLQPAHPGNATTRTAKDGRGRNAATLYALQVQGKGHATVPRALALDIGRGKSPPSLAPELWADECECEFPKTPAGLSCG